MDSQHYLRRTSGLGAVLGVALGCLLAWVPRAYAEPVPARVIVILAKAEPAAKDADLKKIAALEMPPFSAFKYMKILEKKGMSPSLGQPAHMTLPNGRRLQLSLETVQVDGRVKVRVSINRPNSQDYLPGMVVVARPGEPFFVAGQKHAGGTLIIGVTVGKKSTIK